VGSALGELWAKLDIKLCLASHALKNVYRHATRIGMNATSGTPAEAANFADVVLFAPTFWLVQEAIA